MISDAARRPGRDTALAYGFLVLTMVFWGGNAVASRLAPGEISPMLLVAMRWVIALGALSFGGWAALRRDWPVLKGRLVTVIAMGSCGYTLFNALFYVAGHHTQALNIAIIQGAIPIFVLVGALIVYRTRITGAQWLGAALTVAGVLLLALSRQAGEAPLAVGFGDLLMIISCVFYAGYTVGLQRRPAVSGLGFFTAMALVALLTSLPLLAIEAGTGNLLWPTTNGWWLLLYIGLFPSVLSQLLFMRAVDVVGPGRAGVFVNLVPVFGAMLAVLVLGERFGWHHGAALAMVLGGIAIAEWGRQR
jgi:drug/metabolite transporter (DMT)-like permease